MLDVAKENKVTDILVGGDIFLSRVAQSLSVLLTVQDCILSATRDGFRVFMSPGNHDKVSLEDYRSYCHVFDGINGLHVIDNY